LIISFLTPEREVCEEGEAKQASARALSEARLTKDV
jgi:hypothetical protein